MLGMRRLLLPLPPWSFWVKTRSNINCPPTLKTHRDRKSWVSFPYQRWFFFLHRNAARYSLPGVGWSVACAAYSVYYPPQLPTCRRSRARPKAQMNVKSKSRHGIWPADILRWAEVCVCWVDDGLPVEEEEKLGIRSTGCRRSSIWNASCSGLHLRIISWW